MSVRTLSSRVALFLAPLALSGVALHAAPVASDTDADADALSGTTYIVDDNWWVDVDFLDIPPAVAAARPGDRIYVRAGAYSGFSLFEGIKILGANDVKVLGPVEVSDLPPGRRAILAGLNIEGLVIERCDSPVIVQDTTVRRPGSLGGESSHVRVDDCSDVRFRRCTIGGPTGYSPRLEGLLVRDARVELTDSILTGENGLPIGLGERDGVPAMHVVAGGKAHVSRSTFVGGYGGSGKVGADGAPAIVVEDEGSSLLMTGTSVDLVLGGAAGVGQSCGSDGRPAPGLVVGLGASARISGVEVREGDDHGCAGAPIPAIDGAGTVVKPDPIDPTLRLLGTPAAGEVAYFVLTGTPGARAQLDLGRRPVVEELAGVAEDSLLHVLESIDLGVIPMTGEVRFHISLASAFAIAPGRLLMAQGSLVKDDEKRLTQSIPLILK